MASIGVAGNKTVAKLASGFAKPNGVFCVQTAEDLQRLFSTTPARRLPQAGVKDAELFKGAGIITVADLQVGTLACSRCHMQVYSALIPGLSVPQQTGMRALHESDTAWCTPAELGPAPAAGPGLHSRAGAAAVPVD